MRDDDSDLDGDDGYRGVLCQEVLIERMRPMIFAK